MPKRGRPPFKKNPDQILQVTTLAANGFPDEWIAEHLNINPKTLVKYFAEELKTSKKVAAAKLKLTIYQRGMKGELVAALAWLNNHKWGNDGPDAAPSLPLQIGVSFEDGGPGRERRVPYDLAAGERLIKSLPSGGDVLPDENGVNQAVLPAPWPVPEPQAPRVGPVNPTAAMWARLAK